MGRRRDEDRDVPFVHYMEMTTSSGRFEENLGCTFLRWSSFDELDHIVREKELKTVRVNFGTWNEVEKVPWSCHRYFVIRFHNEGRGEIDIKTVACGE